MTDNRVECSVRYNNYHFWEKNRGKVACSFRCSSPKCYACISLKIDVNEIKEPYEITHLNEKHSESCERKPEEFFETREFLQKVRKVLVEQVNVPVQQVYEAQRKAHRAESELVLPDYSPVKSGLKKRRA